MSESLTIPTPDQIAERLRLLRAEQIELRRLLRLARAAENADRLRRERDAQRGEVAHA
jgi:hypothetical protein